MLRRITAAVAAAMMLAGSAGLASAQPAATVELSQYTIPCPGNVVAKADGFAGGEPVQFTLTTLPSGPTVVVATSSANPQGKVNQVVSVGAAGNYRVTATGQTSGRTAFAEFTALQIASCGAGTTYPPGGGPRLRLQLVTVLPATPNTAFADFFVAGEQVQFDIRRFPNGTTRTVLGQAPSVAPVQGGASGPLGSGQVALGRVGRSFTVTQVTLPEGTATLPFTSPTPLGKYVVTAVGLESGRVAQATLNVVRTLPQVGSDPFPFVQVGLVAVLVGAGLVGVTLVRRRSSGGAKA